MTRRIAVWCLILALAPVWAWSQSLAELAAKEKERRKKNKEEGKVVKVVTETDLAEGAPAQTSGEESESGEAPTPTASYAPSSPAPARRTTGASTARRGEGGDDAEARTTQIPGEGSLKSKLAALDGMKRTYERDVANIDKEIEKNKARIGEIDKALISQNATGLPVAQPPDLGVHNPAQIPALQNEKNQLQAKNQELEAKKQTLWQEVEEKARKAGIPPGYIRR